MNLTERYQKTLCRQFLEGQIRVHCPDKESATHLLFYLWIWGISWNGGRIIDPWDTEKNWKNGENTYFILDEQEKLLTGALSEIPDDGRITVPFKFIEKGFEQIL